MLNKSRYRVTLSTTLLTPVHNILKASLLQCFCLLCSAVSLLTLGAHAQRGLQYLVCVCVCLCVCYSTSHFNVIIRTTNNSNLPSSGWRSKILSDFLWKCFVAKLGRFLLVRLHDKSGIFHSVENAHVYESGHVASGHFVLGRDVFCEFDYCLLATGSKYASNKSSTHALLCRGFDPSVQSPLTGRTSYKRMALCLLHKIL